MARKTKSIAAIETAPAANDTATATVVSDSDTASKKPRKRRAPTAKTVIATGTAEDSGGHASDCKLAAKPISGKLGLIATAVAKPKGASIDDLTKTTGWQPHTVRAALTRLRQRGIDAKLTTIDDRKVYRVIEAGA